MGDAVQIRNKELVRRLQRVAEVTGESVEQIAERAVVVYMDAYEASRKRADQHLRDNPALVGQMRSGDPQALRALLDGFEGTQLKQAE